MDRRGPAWCRDNRLLIVQKIGTCAGTKPFDDIAAGQLVDRCTQAVERLTPGGPEE